MLFAATSLAFAPATIEQRAEALLAKLSTEELIQQTWSPYGGAAEELLQKIGDNGVGQLAYKYAGSGSIEERVAARNQLQLRVMNASKHGIPASFSNEALHGAVAGGTIYPELVTQGATWDPALIEQIGAAIASEARAVGVDTAFSPVLNMWVDSRFGRLQEGYSENPTLTTAYAIAQVRGLQGEQPPGVWAPFNASKMVALGKHYAAYGAALGGLNGAPAEMSERTLREFFLPPWRAFAQAGGKAVMASHNTVLGRPMHANPYVTNSILREEFGFGDGYVLSDCNDVPALVSFRVAANLSHAAAKGLAGGVDLDLQCGDQSAYTHLADALKDGTTTLAAVRAAAKRVLVSKFALGLFDQPTVDVSKAAAAVDTPAHRALAQRAAEEGVVLVKNDESLLPLTQVRSIAVVGPNGGCDASVGDGGDDDGKLAPPPEGCAGRVQLLGSYTQYDGTVAVKTVAEALSDEAGDGVRVTWSLGATSQVAAPSLAASRRAEAVTLANGSDVVVAVVGDDSQSSAEWGDRSSLDLPGDQLALLSALATTGKPLVVVLVTGRTATFGAADGNALLDGVPALLSAFRPGQMGGVAIARLLLGKVSPSGKLAQNWARSAGQAMSGASPWLQYRVGKWVANHRSATDPDGRVYDSYNDAPGTPLFYFGHGLTYSSFHMSELRVTQAPARLLGAASTSLRVAVRLTNTGGAAAAEVVQVYCVDPIMDYVRPWKRLLAFQRVPLAAGAATSVTIDVTPEMLAFQDDSSAAGAWRVVGGDYQIRVGPSSVEDTLVANITVVD